MFQLKYVFFVPFFAPKKSYSNIVLFYALSQIATLGGAVYTKFAPFNLIAVLFRQDFYKLFSTIIYIISNIYFRITFCSDLISNKILMVRNSCV